MHTFKWNYNHPKHRNSSSPNNRKNVVSRNCASFTDCISEINNTQIDNAEDIDVVIPMYNLM